jgi:DNA repair protein RadC
MPENAGHRKRVRSKYLKSQIRVLEDYEVFEMLLFYVFPRIDTKELAKAMLKEFGSIHAILNADPIRLKSIKGVGESTLFLVQLLSDLFSRVLLPVNSSESIITNWTSIVSYCRFVMAHKNEECLRALFLNKKMAIIADEVINYGTVDMVMVFPREIAKRALQLGALGVVMVHNHPSNDIKPSREDIEITKLVKAALATIDVTLYDHLIVGHQDCFSFKANMLI